MADYHRHNGCGYIEGRYAMTVEVGGADMDFEVGDIVKLKKPHPCGCSEWEVLRVGMDFRLKCMGCGHMIMVSRKLVEKNVRGHRKPGENS